MLRLIQNEKGVLLPASILLLLFVSLSILSVSAAYQSKYRTYDSLELNNINATIKRIEIFNANKK
ncbi:hypothetical protein WAX74_17430 [Psychrobacillus sp. FJAT-51614]|uniref:Type 4 fimbrial biogenesis protein PilX N-terminal domain-containing protein n=1 Tax=Psychrobacillus mangrovi TaxID=3117745 RepID=A0ABU8F8S4_9BACI